MLEQLTSRRLDLIVRGSHSVLQGNTVRREKEHALPPGTVPRIIVAIPAYNEERFIGSVVIQSRCCADDVVVIDDGSSDQTVQIAEQAGAIVLRHEKNSGKAEAVNTALAYARCAGAECLVFIDGDGQHRPDEIARVAAPVLAGESDMVIGSRFLSVKSKIPAYRKVRQVGFTAVTNLASSVPVTDSQSGFRAFSRKAIETLYFTGTGLSVESEMQFAAKEQGLTICEVPISVVYAEKAKRNPFSHGMQIIENILKLMSMHRPLFFFSLQGAMMVLAGAFLAAVTVDIYGQTHVLAVGYALVSVLLLMLGTVTMFVGLILHTLRANLVELKRIALAAQKPAS